jgi:hypothetical protein
MFARRGVKHAKGSFGKEESIGANSGFPKHKELFTEGYYSGEPQNDDFESQFASANKSTLEGRFEAMDEKYKRDAIRYSKHGYEIPQLGGGILKTYKKVQGQRLEEIAEGDYWNAKRDSQEQVSKYF